MIPVNLFLTEDGVLKLGYYGLTTQAECYSVKETDCDRLRFAPEILEGEYEIKSDVWSFGIALIELMGITPHSSFDIDELLEDMDCNELPFDDSDIGSQQLIGFLKKCFEESVSKRWSVKELMDVSVLLRRMMSSIHL